MPEPVRPGPTTRTGARRWPTPDRWRRVAAPVVTAGAVLAAWWLGSAALDVTVLLPGPVEVAEAFGARQRYLLTEARATLGHVLVGFAVAGVASVTCAVLLAASDLARAAVLPLLLAVQVVPTVAVAPLLVIWAGYGLTAKLIMVSLVAFFPILVNAVAGLRSVPRELLDLARFHCAGRWQTMARIRVPHALPAIFTGLKVGITLALIGAVIAELTTPNAGLGMVILRAGQTADTATAFAAFGLLALIGIGCYRSLLGLERWLLPWARATTS